MIRAFVFPFLYCVLMGSAWSMAFKKKFSDSLAPALLLHIIVVLLSGMLLHKLSIGIWGGILFAAIVAVHGVRSFLPDVRSFLKHTWNHGLYVFTILYIFCFLLNFKKTFFQFDEFAQWGMFLKENLRLNALYVESPLPFFHKDYVPAPVIFETIWCRLAGRFHEADVYRAIQMLMFSMVLPVFNSFQSFGNKMAIGSSAWTRSIFKEFFQLGSIFLIIFMFLFIKTPDTTFFYTITVDYLLGVVFFYCMSIIFKFNTQDFWYQAALLSLALSMLVMTKSTGVALLPMLFAFYIAVYFLYYDRHPILKKCMLASTVIVFPLLLWLGYNIFIEHVGDAADMTYFGGIQSYKGVKLSTIARVFTGGADIPYLNELRDKFFKATFTIKIFAGLPYAVLVLLAALAIFFFAYLKKNDATLRKKMILSSCFIFFAGAAYACLMYALYAVAFPAERAALLSSYERYMNSFFIAALLLVFFIYYDSRGGRNIAWDFVIVVAFLSYLVFGNYRTLYVTYMGALKKDKKMFTAISEINKEAIDVSSMVKENESIYIVRRKEKTPRISLAMRFYAHPRIVNGGLIGPSKARWSDNLTPMQLKTAINKHDYFYVSHFDKDFIRRYSEIFEDTEILRNKGLYKSAVAADGKLRLELVAVIEPLTNVERMRLTLTEAAWRGDYEMVALMLERGEDVNATDKNGASALMHAAWRGYTDIAMLLIDRGADVNIIGKNDSTALMNAVFNGHEDIAMLLLDKGADANVIDKKEGASLLMHAIWSGQLNAARSMIERGADINTASKSGGTALMNAIVRGNEDIAKMLVEKGADLNAVDGQGWSVLMHAAAGGRADMVAFFVERGANIHVINENGYNALLAAIAYGHEDVARFLIGVGAEVNVCDEYGISLLTHAVWGGMVDAAKLMIAVGADVNSGIPDDGVTPLMSAAELGDESVIHALIDAGADIKAVDESGASALRYAIWNGHVEAAQLLLRKGADFKEVADDVSVLFSAARSGNAGMVKLFIDKKANVGLADESGISVLMHAVQNSYEVARILLEAGADANEADAVGRTVLMAALAQGHADTANMLIAHKADVHAVDKAGVSTLMYAAQHGQADIVSVLLDKGVNVDAVDAYGRTALILAAKRGDEDIVKLLIEKGCNGNVFTKNGETALEFALRGKHGAVVRLLKAAGAREAAVAHAVLRGQIAGVGDLIASGADVDAVGADGWTALMHAAFRGDEAAAGFLLEKGAAVNAAGEDGGTALMNAVFQGHADMVRRLIHFGANVNAAKKDGLTAFDFARERPDILKILEEAKPNEAEFLAAARHGSIHIIENFISRGVNLESLDAAGWTALRHAVHQGYTEIVAMLLEAGARVDVQTGGDMLMEAVVQEQEGIAKLLIAQGADANASDEMGASVLMHAAWHGQEAVARMLLEAGARANAASEDGNTALMNAVWRGHAGMVRILLAAGADVNAAKKDGFTALKFAKGNEDILAMLKGVGAHE